MTTLNPFPGFHSWGNPKHGAANAQYPAHIPASEYNKNALKTKNTTTIPVPTPGYTYLNRKGGGKNGHYMASSTPPARTNPSRYNSTYLKTKNTTMVPCPELMTNTEAFRQMKVLNGTAQPSKTESHPQLSPMEIIKALSQSNDVATKQKYTRYYNALVALAAIKRPLTEDETDLKNRIFTEVQSLSPDVLKSIMSAIPNAPPFTHRSAKLARSTGRPGDPEFRRALAEAAAAAAGITGDESTDVPVRPPTPPPRPPAGILAAVARVGREADAETRPFGFVQPQPAHIPLGTTTSPVTTIMKDGKPIGFKFTPEEENDMVDELNAGFEAKRTEEKEYDNALKFYANNNKLTLKHYQDVAKRLKIDTKDKRKMDLIDEIIDLSGPYIRANFLNQTLTATMVNKIGRVAKAEKPDGPKKPPLMVRRIGKGKSKSTKSKK